MTFYLNHALPYVQDELGQLFDQLNKFLFAHAPSLKSLDYGMDILNLFNEVFQDGINIFPKPEDISDEFFTTLETVTFKIFGIRLADTIVLPYLRGSKLKKLIFSVITHPPNITNVLKGNLLKNFEQNAKTLEELELHLFGITFDLAWLKNCVSLKTLKYWTDSFTLSDPNLNLENLSTLKNIFVGKVVKEMGNGFQQLMATVGKTVERLTLEAPLGKTGWFNLCTFLKYLSICNSEFLEGVNPGQVIFFKSHRTQFEYLMG